MRYSDEQEHARRLIEKGMNVFLTGPGGSGKTTLIRDVYNKNMGKKKIQVTALTGCASVLLECNARTIHSFAGIGLGHGTVQDNVDRVKKNLRKVASWRKLDVLIVDEVSMMSRKLFETLDAVARACRNSSDVFGGLQVIFSGDFYQIRPIGSPDDPASYEFCFESPLWNKTFGENQVCLTTLFRQYNDPLYSTILNQIREGYLDEKYQTLLATIMTREHENLPVRIFPLRRCADAVNTRELMKLSSDNQSLYNMETILDLPMTAKELERRTHISLTEINTEISMLKKNVLCDENITLKKGARVMCIVNKDISQQKYLCNGNQGTVVDFHNNLPFVRFDNGIECVMEKHVWESESIPGIGISQVPLILAWAMTIHKAQGSTMDCAEIDVGGDIFESGQTYVALSRLKSLGGLYLKAFDPKSIYVNPRVKEFYARLKMLSHDTKCS
jgi:ATP-dependent DNA helicase PIF1